MKISSGEYRIDDLARLSDTTVRNVRAYQDRGLLPPARREGRVLLYGDTHLARLQLITQLLERGYTLSNIGELITAWEAGQDVGELLGLEAALAEPWTEQAPVEMTSEELASLFGDTFPDTEAIALAVQAGVIDPPDDGDASGTGTADRDTPQVVYVVRNPRLLQVGAQLVAAGIPLSAVLELGTRLRADIDRVARSFVELVAEHVFEPVGEPIPPEEVGRLTDVVRRLRPLASEAVDAQLADAMEHHVREELRERLDRILSGLDRNRTEAS